MMSQENKEKVIQGLNKIRSEKRNPNPTPKELQIAHLIQQAISQGKTPVSICALVDGVQLTQEEDRTRGIAWIKIGKASLHFDIFPKEDRVDVSHILLKPFSVPFKELSKEDRIKEDLQEKIAQGETWINQDASIRKVEREDEGEWIVRLVCGNFEQSILVGETSDGLFYSIEPLCLEFF